MASKAAASRRGPRRPPLRRVRRVRLSGSVPARAARRGEDRSGHESGSPGSGWPWSALTPGTRPATRERSNAIGGLAPAPGPPRRGRERNPGPARSHLARGLSLTHGGRWATTITRSSIRMGPGPPLEIRNNCGFDRPPHCRPLGHWRVPRRGEVCQVPVVRGRPRAAPS